MVLIFTGKGPIAPVCPTSFEFKVPEGAPLTLYPSVGTVKPGEVRKVTALISLALFIAQKFVRL